jgi:dipeptide/tripeptide permease
MKKGTIRAIVVAAILLIAYNLVVFAVPFEKNAAYWVSYGFTMVSFLVVAASIYIAFIKNPDARSRFYGFPIARIGVLYGIAQLVVSLAVMTFAVWVPWWAALAAYAIGLAVSVIGLIASEVVVDEIQVQDEQLKVKVSVMRSLQSKVSQLAGQTDASTVKALADEFRYSDPVSNDVIADAEADLAAAVDELQAAVVDGDKESVTILCKKVSVLLAERNRLCKLNKH